MRRQIAYFIVIFVGFLALAGNFINYHPLNNFIDNVATLRDNVIPIIEDARNKGIFLGKKINP